MIRQTLVVAVVFATTGLPTLAQNEEAVPEESPAVPMRPGDEKGEIPVSDSLAECASMLAVASGLTTNLVYRNSFSTSSGSWFATSGDVALQEGELPAEDLWENKVTNWAGQVSSVDGLGQHPEWMAYCVHIGNEHGLDTSLFLSYVE